MTAGERRVTSGRGVMGGLLVDDEDIVVIPRLCLLPGFGC